MIKRLNNNIVDYKINVEKELDVNISKSFS